MPKLADPSCKLGERGSEGSGWKVTGSWVGCCHCCCYCCCHCCCCRPSSCTYTDPPLPLLLLLLLLPLVLLPPLLMLSCCFCRPSSC